MDEGNVIWSGLLIMKKKYNHVRWLNQNTVIKGYSGFGQGFPAFLFDYNVPFVMDSQLLVEVVLWVPLTCLLGQLPIPRNYHVQLALVNWHCPQWVNVHFSCKEEIKDCITILHTCSVGDKLLET